MRRSLPAPTSSSLTRTKVLLAALLVGCISTPNEGPDGRIGSKSDLWTISAASMQARVDVLASDAMGGRAARTEQGGTAARYVADSFEESGLERFESLGGWYQQLDGGLSPNVLGFVRGREAGVLVLSAHYDHLPPRNRGEDRIFNGADDNASGTAALIELAAYFARRAAAGRRPPYSLLFAAFTGEEIGLLGSEAFVADPPVPLDSILADINMDMVSRGEQDLIFCEPGGPADGLLAAALRANERLGELDMRVGEHPEWLAQSDQDSFLAVGLPALYFGVEDHEDYHQVTDSADKILPELIARVARLVARTVAELDPSDS